MTDNDLNVHCKEPQDIIKQCFFNIEVYPLLFEDRQALNYFQIIKAVEHEPLKFLGIKRHRKQIRNIEVFNDGIRACKELINKEVTLFYAGVNAEENEFHALLTGATLDEVLRFQLNQFSKQTSRPCRFTDLLSESTLKKYEIEDDDFLFKQFFNEKLESFFFLVRVRNGYDLGKGSGANFSIGRFIDAHQMNIITIDYSEKLNSLFGSGFKHSLLDFIAFYYKMYTIPVDSPEQLKAIFFDFSDIQLPANIMGHEDSFFEKIHRLGDHLDVFLKSQPEYSYALLIDYFLKDVAVSSHHGREEDWKVIKDSFYGHYRLQKLKGLATTIIDGEKRSDYEERTLRKYEEINSFYKPART